MLDETQLAAFVAEAQELGIDTAFVGMDTAKRASSLDIAKMEAAMHSFGAQLPELDMDFPEEKEVYQALAFTEKSMSISLTRNTANCVLYVGMKTVWMSFQKKAPKQQRSCVAEQLGIAQEDVICFGDGQNDREMLTAAGVGVAMGNAVLRSNKSQIW